METNNEIGIMDFLVDYVRQNRVVIEILGIFGVFLALVLYVLIRQIIELNKRSISKKQLRKERNKAIKKMIKKRVTINSLGAKRFGLGKSKARM